MPTADFHFRGDTQVVNGLTAYILGSEQSNTQITCIAGALGGPTAYYNSDVSIRHSDSSEDSLGSSIAQTSRNADGEGYQDGTWSCPETSLVSTDAIKIVERVTAGASTDTETWITGQLGWVNLEATTWTFHRYTFYAKIPVSPYITTARLEHGTSTYDTQLQDVSYTAYIDIGLKFRISGSTITIGALSDLTGQKLRIRNGSTTYALPVVATTNGSASTVRIYDGSSVKALVKL